MNKEITQSLSEQIKDRIEILKTQLNSDKEEVMFTVSLSNLKYVAWELDIRDMAKSNIQLDESLVNIAEIAMSNINGLCISKGLEEVFPGSLELEKILRCFMQYFRIKHNDWSAKEIREA